MLEPPGDLHPATILHHWAQHRPEDVALILGDEQRTWRQLAERATAVAGALRAGGVGRGDRVAFLDKNGLEYFEILFGAAQIGAVLVAVNWRLAAPEIAYVVADAAATHVIIGSGFSVTISAIRTDVPAVTTVVGLDGATGCDMTYEDWLSTATPARAAEAGPNANDTVLQLYTSGTTGHPKGVMSSAANLEASVRSATVTFGFDAASRVLVAMPLFHIGGAGWAIGGLAAGGTGVIIRDLTPQLLLDTLVAQRITHAFVVPAVIEMLLATPGIDTADLSALRCLAYGAAPISEGLLARAQAALDVGFFQIYGMTEATGAATVLGPHEHKYPGLVASAGRPVPGVEVRIADPETGTERAVGEVGEIWLRSRQVMQGYWKLPAETAATLVEGGWLRTGDAGCLDADGYLFIRDRVKDMIISGGENIYPAEVEAALSTHPDVASAAVIGIPSDKWGETVLAVVVARNADATERSLIDHCRSRLAHYKCPTKVEFVDQLPMNPSGKVLKRELRQPYWTSQARAVH
jgi:long-chain acyl-CoA synthetase